MIPTNYTPESDNAMLPWDLCNVNDLINAVSHARELLLDVAYDLLNVTAIANTAKAPIRYLTETAQERLLAAAESWGDLLAVENHLADTAAVLAHQEILRRKASE